MSIEEQPNSRFYDVEDIMNLSGGKICRSTAYSLIRQWNKELEKDGYTVMKAGIVAKKYADFKMGWKLDEG